MVPHGPTLGEIVLRIIPGLLQISHTHLLVAATGTARRNDRRRRGRTHTGICVHPLARMNPMLRGHSGRSSENWGGKTAKNDFAHGRRLLRYPPQARPKPTLSDGGSKRIGGPTYPPAPLADRAVLLAHRRIRSMWEKVSPQ